MIDGKRKLSNYKWPVHKMHISNVTVNGCQVLPVWTADCLKSKCAFKSKTLKAVFCLNISVHFYMAECVQFNLFQSKRFLYIDSVGFLHYVFFFGMKKSLPQSRYVIHLSEERNTPGKPKEPSLSGKHCQNELQNVSVRLSLSSNNSPAKLEMAMKARSTKPGFSGESSSVAGGLDCWSFLCRH